MFQIKSMSEYLIEYHLTKGFYVLAGEGRDSCERPLKE